MLVVLSRAEGLIRDRIAPLLPDSFPVGLDLFPLTRAEIAEREGSPILEAARRSGWRYARR